MSLEGKVVLITGAGLPNGIGAGVARCFAAEGARVVVTDLEGSRIDDTIASVAGDVTGLVADASSQQAMGEAAARIVGQHGHIDVLVNNAGVGGPVLDVDDDRARELSTETLSDEAWDAQLAANLRTTFASSSAVSPRLEDGGSIINIASIAALGPSTTLPAYGAAKAGVVHLTKTLAMQLAPRRIRVNCICPGILWTRAWEMLTANMQATNPRLADLPQRQIFEDVIARSTPLGEEQTPEDIGHLAVFFASAGARMITGQVVAVDGGISLA